MTDGQWTQGCESFQHELAELSLGVLTGRARAATLTHLDGCPACRATVEQLSAAADRLVHIGTEIEPPVGFETRVFERLGLNTAAAGGRAGPIHRLAARQSPRRRSFDQPSRHRLVWAAAAVVVGMLGFGAGWLGHSSHPAARPAALPGAAGRPLASARLLEGGRAMGEVFTWAETPSWLFMTVQEAGLSAEVSCTVTTASGARITIGRFWLSSGYGAWGAPLPVPASQLRSASVVTATGAVLATARLG